LTGGCIQGICEGTIPGIPIRSVFIGVRLADVATAERIMRYNDRNLQRTMLLNETGSSC